MPVPSLYFADSLSPEQIADLRLAASKMTGATRRAFEAEMALKYCQGNPLWAETVFGWNRQTVALGLAEKRSGIICLGAQSAFSGRLQANVRWWGLPTAYRLPQPEVQRAGRASL